jgi:hypothetical protein
MRHNRVSTPTGIVQQHTYSSYYLYTAVDYSRNVGFIVHFVSFNDVLGREPLFHMLFNRIPIIIGKLTHIFYYQKHAVKNIKK